MEKKVVELKEVKPGFMPCWFCSEADSKYEIILNRLKHGNSEVASFFICDECLEVLKQAIGISK